MPLSTSDFDYIRTLVRRNSAIVLEEEKAYLVEARLLPLARTEGLTSTSDLVVQLRQRVSGNLHQKVIEAMTTNETSFFRDLQPFEALKKVVLPALIQKRGTQRTLNMWCGAASTGQEPYTIALTLREYFPSLQNWTIKFVATDLSTDVLAKAKAGRYNQMEVNRGLPATMLVKYFQRQGTEWQFKDEIRNMVEFKQLNLIDNWPTMQPLDIVFLRNVLIYFDVATKKQILGKIRRLLQPDGYLFLGGAETTFNLDDSFERLDFERSGCYRIRTS